jgi:NADP-dependent 3-hydroxy acid dehydrogenase YdfG
MVEGVLAAFGSIDILVCSAGINVAQRSLRSLDPADWDRVLATNLTGSFNLVHFVLPSMRQRGNGLVIQVASVSGMRANTLSGAAYSASKFAQSALGIGIGREERGRGIRSTVLYPGEVNTSFLDQRAGRPGGGDDSRRQSILQPEDIAAAVRFLVELPPRVHVPELVIKPTIDDFS